MKKNFGRPTAQHHPAYIATKQIQIREQRKLTDRLPRAEKDDAGSTRRQSKYIRYQRTKLVKIENVEQCGVRLNIQNWKIREALSELIGGEHQN